MDLYKTNCRIKVYIRNNVCFVKFVVNTVVYYYCVYYDFFETDVMLWYSVVCATYISYKSKIELIMLPLTIFLELDRISHL